MRPLALSTCVYRRYLHIKVDVAPPWGMHHAIRRVDRAENSSGVIVRSSQNFSLQSNRGRERTTFAPTLPLRALTVSSTTNRSLHERLYDDIFLLAISIPIPL